MEYINNKTRVLKRSLAKNAINNGNMSAEVLKSICLLIVCFYTTVAIEHDLPASIERCHRFDPKLNQCLLAATKKIKPYLIKGIPEVKIGAIEPFTIPEVILEQGTSALNFKATLTNILIRGLSNYDFTQFDFDVPNLQWFIKGTVQPVELEGDYAITGRVLVAPIEGKGTFKAGIDTCNITAYQKVKMIQKKGVDYVKPIITNTTIDVGGPKVKLNGLFGGDEELGKVTNQVINENVDVLFQEIKPVIEKVITEVLEKTLLDALEDNVPFDKLYPPIP